MEPYLISMQPTHSSLDLRTVDILDPLPLLVLDENTRKKSHHVRSVQEHIRLIEGHTLVDGSCQVLNPHPVLTRHMLFLSTFLLFTRK